MKTIFLNILDLKKETGIADLCKEKNIDIKKLSNSDLSKPVLSIVSDQFFGNLKNVQSNNVIPLMYNMPEIMIFSEFSEDFLHEFLMEYKRRGIEKVELKAMITPYNLNWTLYDLIEHLKEENQAHKA